MIFFTLCAKISLLLLENVNYAEDISAVDRNFNWITNYPGIKRFSSVELKNMFTLHILKSAF